MVISILRSEVVMCLAVAAAAAAAAAAILVYSSILVQISSSNPFCVVTVAVEALHLQFKSPAYLPLLHFSCAAICSRPSWPGVCC
jgi:proline racemase